MFFLQKSRSLKKTFLQNSPIPPLGDFLVSCKVCLITVIRPMNNYCSVLTYTCVDLSLISMSLLLVQKDGVNFFSPFKFLTCSHISLAIIGGSGFFFGGGGGFPGPHRSIVLTCRISASAEINLSPQGNSFTLSLIHEFCLTYEDY